MVIAPIAGMPELNSSPLASIVCDGEKVILEADDKNELRLRFTFAPYQAMKIVTADCFTLPDGVSAIPRTIMQLRAANWFEELCVNAKMTDNDSEFMEKAIHYLLPLDNDFLEIVAWGVEVETVDA